MTLESGGFCNLNDKTEKLVKISDNYKFNNRSTGVSTFSNEVISIEYPKYFLRFADRENTITNKVDVFNSGSFSYDFSNKKDTRFYMLLHTSMKVDGNADMKVFDEIVKSIKVL